MKKLLFIILLSLPLLCFSQSAMTNPNGAIVDTVSNTTPEACTATIKGWWDVASFVVLVTKISGTVAGTVALQGSNEVSKGYATIGSASNLTDAATQTFIFAETPKKYVYYQILITGTGTLSASYSAAYYTVKQ